MVSLPTPTTPTTPTTYMAGCVCSHKQPLASESESGNESGLHIEENPPTYETLYVDEEEGVKVSFFLSNFCSICLDEGGFPGSWWYSCFLDYYLHCERESLLCIDPETVILDILFEPHDSIKAFSRLDKIGILGSS